MISLDKVTVTFGNTIALQELTLDVHPGVTGVFGPNGAGKSTLLRLIAGLLRPSSGELVVDRTRWSTTRRAEELRGRLGYAGHRSGLYARLSLRENLELFATLHGAPREHVDAVIEALGLESEARKAVGDLSAGIKRRAAVARALVHEPDILLLDEPYANVDDEAAELISDAVVGWRTPGRTALVATHGAKKVKRFADASLILQRGRAVSYRVSGELTTV